MTSSLIQRFYATAHRHADAPALISDAGVQTYAGLAAQVRHVAALIDATFAEHKGRSAGPGDRVGICMGKSPALYAAVFAILSTGASYVPIDPELTEENQAFILATCQCSVVICQEGLLEGRTDVVRLVPALPLMAAEPATVLASRAGPRDDCYTIFTSGSTGRPKGVQIQQQNLLNLLDWMQAEFGFGPHHRVLQYSTINFDASVLDIFPTLLAGAALCIPDKEQRLSESLLAAFCARHAVNHAFLPPSLLGVLSASRFPTLKTVLTGGEACSQAAIQSWLPGRHIYNLYGPTECTVLISFKRMQAETSPGNIGQAIHGMRLHVLDENMQAARRGELHAAGLSVSPGYLGDAENTARKFIRCPSVDADTLYKTGDIVELDDTGDLHFIGRADRQVKVRGYRVELEEIESALRGLGYAHAAVTFSPAGALQAWLAPEQGLKAAQLREQLGKHLADYKIPQLFAEMARLPLKPSGKVAYDALPDIQLRPEQGAPDEEPATGEYALILELWADTLRMPVHELHSGSNFRDLGGTSLDIVQLFSAIETRFGARVPFMGFLNDPTPQFLLPFLRT